MKKLLIIIAIVTLPLIAFFQYKNYRRFHPPVAYEYKIHPEIDALYHDPSAVEEYYRKALEIGAFARSQWRNNGIDVRFPDEANNEAVIAAELYNTLLSRTRLLEAQLVKSYQLKATGKGNEEIKAIEEGAPPVLAAIWSERQPLFSAQIGDVGEAVFMLQERLINKGYEHRLDGVFGVDTQNALTSFQQDNNLYPSGQMSRRAALVLFQE
ncbi:MAG: peptidoglycan-binding domain-containing protein [Bacteroidota bacterium]